MTKKPTLFVTVDIETTMKRRIAFDIAWKIHDRKNCEYSRGSYVIREAFHHDVPFFAEKLGHYFDDAYSHLIKPGNILDVKAEFNAQVKGFQDAGHRVIACAYNSAFDFKYLPETISILTDGKVSKWMETKVELMDIWDYWGSSVPLNYRATPSASGKYFSTSAESAYRWEFNKAEFIERHIAWSDVEIESEILCRALSRKKKMPIVSNPAQFAGAVWKKINTRLGIDGKTPIAMAA
jgi:hypothetical protein